MLYTGGTTGMPKGVLWRHGDLWGVMAYGANPLVGQEGLPNSRAAGAQAEANGRPVSLIACPLMHGTGLIGAVIALNSGGVVAMLPSRTFDASELLDEIENTRASRVTLAGMGFCTPILEALDRAPGKWDVSCVRTVTSSGAMWPHENKQGLLRHMPGAMLADVLGSSEAVGIGMSLASDGNSGETARFLVGAHTAVFAEDGRRVTPGSGDTGRLAVGGFLPLGYYKDEAKTAATFPILEGRRWSMPGDWATVNADGTLNLLGRGSQCINTGGEKVFPEEVEESLKRHPHVRDAAVVGLPDPRFGERICALVEADAGRTPTADEMTKHVRAQLASYKAPRAVFFVESLNRAPNGKLDYKSLKAIAESLQTQSPA
jgi:fatty-acyl-CoA synthase